ncbi:hypothetical protein ILUMI_04235 [Ignelater luminosus]|uniref:DDE Tnp4 domain-containing protein n=1 Tax=Ignelater luminosus TaxID=2038154 RepID=A0A8K0DEU4_IGNLU|nr:hypothetical protein ILUMI_04235 [Ignelater luminosus]
MADHQFQLHFRMSTTTFEYLLHAVYGVRQNSTVSVGQPQFNLDKQLMITVWYLGNLESFRSLANRFAISKSTCWETLYRTCRLLLKVNKKLKIISWPHVNRANEISQSIDRPYHMQGVIGMIDGTAIEINAPKEHRMSYFNRKSYFSVVLQGICDHNMLFTDVYAGQPGSKHDYAVFEKSDIFERINNKEVSFPGNSYIIGDLAYKLSNFFMVGFKHNRPLSQREKNAFALLKGRFRRLKLLETQSLDLIAMLIVSACILHNVCIMESDLLDNIDTEEELRELRQGPEDQEVLEQNADNEAIVKRLDIVNSLPLLRNNNA